MYGGTQLWSYVNQALLQICMAKSFNYPKTSNKMLPYTILKRSVQRFRQ
jgi:hypothetical protein